MSFDVSQERLNGLVRSAQEARAHAYAPYSGFAVGASLLAGDGEIFTGVNVENASYGLAMCAERAAVAASIANGRRDIRAIAVAGPETVATPPCGACRQVLYEFNPSMTVVYTAPGGVVTTTLERLLPESFGPDTLT